MKKHNKNLLKEENEHWSSTEIPKGTQLSSIKPRRVSSSNQVKTGPDSPLELDKKG